ncbi:MAG: response regulator [Candidatus Cloacimonetes bacterium]|nr:response regulator [Candidatus Cloacimonadota bacterium]
MSKANLSLHKHLINFDRNLIITFNIFVLSLLIANGVISSYFQDSVSHKNQVQLEKTLVSLISDSIKSMDLAGRFHSRRLIEKFVQTQKRLSFIMVVNHDGYVTAHSDSGQNNIPIEPSQLELMKQVITNQKPIISSITYNSEAVEQVILPFNHGYRNHVKETIFVGFSNKYYKELAQQNRNQLFLLIFLLALLSIAASYYLGKRFGTPVVNLAIRFHSILDRSPLAIFMNSKAQDEVYTSSQFLELQKLYPDFLKEQSDKVFEKGTEIKESLYFKNIDEIEKYFICVSFPLMLDKSGEVTDSCTLAIENTTKIKAEQSIRDNENTLATTLNAITHAVVTSNSLHQIIHMNSVAESLLNISLEEVKYQKFSKLFQITNSDQHSFSFTGELKNLKISDQKKLLISLKVSKIRDENLNFMGNVYVFHDVTQQIHMEEQLRQSQKMESVGRLAGGIAHDFNNMLGGIIGCSELLRPYIVDNPKAFGFSDMIIKTSQKAADLTKKLLSFSRKGAFVLQSVDVHSTLLNSIELSKTTLPKTIEVNYQLNANQYYCNLDESQFQNAVINLIINSKDAILDNGLIEVITKNTHLDKHYCINSPFELDPGEYLQIILKDDGIGIKKDIQSQIFEPFFSTKGVGKGTGLGLSSVYGCIKEHSGAIILYSEENKGTSFHIFLKTTEQKVSQNSKAIEYIPHLGQGDVLLVDDEEAIRSSSSALLESMGYNVEVAKDGQEGFDYFLRNPNKYKLIVLDMLMPKLSGEEVFLKVIEQNPRQKIIISSGFIGSAKIELLIKKGLSGFLQKPSSRDQFNDLLNRIFT